MIGLNELALIEIVNALVLNDPESKEQYLMSINNESGEGTQNSIYTQQWDYRYNTIIKIAKKYGLKYGKIDRGRLWQAVYVIGQDNEIYVFFSHMNMRSIIRKGKDNHYLKLLNLFNKALDNWKPLVEQLSIWDNDFEEYRDIETLKKQAEDVVKVMEGNPTKVMVIAFSKSFNNSAEALMFNSRHQIVWRKDLSSLIKSDYRFVLNTDNVAATKQESSTEIETKKQKIVRLKNNG